MEKNIEGRARVLTEGKQKKKVWQRVLLWLSAITVFCTTYALILPALTMVDDDVVVCGMVNHKHDENCYVEETAYAFSCMEELHQHDESCFDEDGRCVCGVADYRIHTHGDECYDENGSLICPLPEISEHFHTEDCYETESAAVCGLEEHSHGDECYDENGELTCEIEEHVHTEDCFLTKTVLVCSLEQPVYYGNTEVTEAAFHQHESACYDENGELICGHIEILRHEHVGCVTESTVETLVCELPEHEHDMGCFSEKKDETQYFCGFDYEHTHNEDCYMGHKLICTLSEHTHTEDCLVEKTEEAKVVTIESEPAEDGAIAVITGVLPEGAAAKVEAVPLSTMELVDLFGEEKAGSMTGYVAYDIHVTVDGEEWEPAEGESLSVVMKNLPVAGETVGVLHVEEEATETENAVTEEVEAVVTPEGDVEFETDGFSLYVFYTVDFHYNDTCFSVYVGTDVTLSEIFAQLDIEKNAADAISVVFSSPELIAVESIENDWILHTLEPFNTEETLTIVFSDGETLVLDVTDASIIGGSWQKVVTMSDPSATYIIVNAGGNNALTRNGTGYSRTELTIKDINGRSGHYSIKHFYGMELRDEMQFHFGSTIGGGGSTTVQTGSQPYYLVLTDGTNGFNTTGANLNVSYTSNKGWLFRTGNNSRNYRYLQYSNGSFGKTSGTDTDYAYMDIYKYVPGTIRSTVDNSYSVCVYSVPVDENGVEAGVPLYHGTILVNSTGATNMETLFDGYEIEGMYQSAYYGAESTHSIPNVVSVSRTGGNTLSINTESGSTLITQDDGRAIFLLYEPGSPYDPTPVNPGEDIDPDKAPDHYKRIDWLGDGVENPETDVDNKANLDKTDLYRLYLDVGPEVAYQPLDVLFILDRSSSMTTTYGQQSAYDATDILGRSGVLRRLALDGTLNGLPEGATTTTEPTQLYSNGIIQTIMDLNSSNQVAVGWFRNGNGYTYGWGPGRPVLDGPTVSGTGTNYMAGLNQARTMLTDSIIQNDGRQKILFFISDGQPTEYITAEGETIRTTDNWREGYPQYDRTMKAIADFRKDFIDDGCTYDQVQCYCIGIGTFEYDYLEAISSDGTVFGTTNFQQIRRVLDDKVTQGVGHYSNLTVVDELSEDVDFYTTDLDMMVQLVPTNGVGKTKILYQNGSVTQEGTGIIKSVSYSTSPKKTVTAVFEPSYQEVGGYRYCLSFNVKVNQNAYDKYAGNLEEHGVGYYSSAAEFEENTIDGDQGTDYGANISSSVKPGFFSNKEATLTYTQSHIGETGVTRTVPFDRPVVQVSVTSLNVEKVWADGNANHDSDSVTVVLHAVDDQKNDKEVGTIVLNKQNQWKYTFTDIPKGYNYYVEETSVKDGYAPTITWSEETSTFRVENVPSDISVKFRKVDEAERAIEEAGVGFAIYEDELAQKQVGTFATDGNGEFTVEGVRLGKTYWIKEQSAPKGFKPMTEIHSFTVTADGATFAFGDVYLLEDNDGTILIKNFGDDRLPMTGGHGREKLYAFGGAILATVVFVGAVKLIGNRRKKKAE